MIKKSILAILAALFLLSNAANVHAQKLYLITGGDIQDAIIGKAAREDIKRFAGLFSLFKPDVQIVYYNQTQLWTGPDIYYSNNMKEAVLTAIQRCPAKPSDKIVFYWSGHGAYDRYGHYLFMPKGRGPRVMYRSEIMNALKRKGASLTVLITDSCHVYYETPVTAPACAPEPVIEEKCDEGIPPLFRSLFFNCRGEVNINSSRPGEKSYCTYNGSIFTSNFVRFASNNRDNNMGWNSFLKGVQQSIREDDDSRYIKEDQNFKVDQNICVWGYLPLLYSFPQTPCKIVKYEKKDDERSPFLPIFHPLYHPKKGDRIIAVNDTTIENAAHFNQIIRDAGIYIMLTLIDHQTGETINMATVLNPPGPNTRLGINIQDDPDGGVRVTGVLSGMPGERCYIMSSLYYLDDNDFWGYSAAMQSSEFYPEYGDRIISVNDTEIRDEAHFRQVIRDADTKVRLTVIDHRTAKKVNITTNLNPRGLTTRLGIYIQSDNLGGVMVTGVVPGSPGEKCYILNNDSDNPVRSDE